MTIRPELQARPTLIRCDSISSAEIKKDDLVSSYEQKRHISFNYQVMVRSIEHIDDKDEAEIRATWYRKEEYRKIRSSMADTVRKISSGKFSGDSDAHCARGLEFRTPYGSQLRKKNKLEALVAVLDEQDRQFDEGCLDEELLARAYMESSRTRLEEAQRRGELDEQEARWIHEGETSLTTLMNYSIQGEDEYREKETQKPGIRRLFKKFERVRDNV